MTPAELTITYRRSGGLAGVDLAATAQGRDLSDGDTVVARHLLADPPAGSPATARRSDQFDHRLTVGDGIAERSFHWSDAEVPDAVRPLLAALTARAEPTR